MSQIVPGLLQSPVTHNEFLPAIGIAVSHLLLFCHENCAQEHVVNYHTFKYGCSGYNINQSELRIGHKSQLTNHRPGNGYLEQPHLPIDRSSERLWSKVANPYSEMLSTS